MEKYNVLIVEDEKDTSFILNKLLTKNGYEVVVAHNGQEALEVLKNYLPKIILADWTMPVMDGLELCNILKADEKYKLIYFLMLTARALLKDRITGLDVGADDFLVKPIENQELLARIRTGIRIHNLQNELKNVEHDKAIVEMACTIGHKINNPLSSLIMSVQNLQEELEQQQQNSFKDDLIVIKESIERIKVLANDLIHLQNPEMTDYSGSNKMLKLD
ncbi:MAG: response regulator [Ignavibacteriaceae bacterium]|nr:response regulator [Ignavibacteriaceae bacterium]